MPKFLVNKALRYPTNPAAAREHWEYKNVAAGDVVEDIPEQSLAWLLDRGHIAPIELPDDFPAREILAAHDITTLEQVEARFDELGELDGIGPKTLEKIAQALVRGSTGFGEPLSEPQEPADEGEE